VSDTSVRKKFFMSGERPNSGPSPWREESRFLIIILEGFAGNKLVHILSTVIMKRNGIDRPPWGEG
jgi:hypothetical protein